MAKAQAIQVQQKKELVSKEEKTIPAKHYIPLADIYETADALTLSLEVPGVEKKNLNIRLENDVLKIDAQIDFAKYEGSEPVYTEYNVGHFQRAFTLSSKIAQDKITAELNDGVLTVTLKKSKESTPRRIPLS
jgi:HSP20 family molecular chaperone IbpA